MEDGTLIIGVVLVLKDVFMMSTKRSDSKGARGSSSFLVFSFFNLEYEVMIGRILGFGILLSFVGLIPFVLLYVFDWKSSWLWIIQLVSSFSIVCLFAYIWVDGAENLKSFKGFSSLYISVLSVLFLSSFINLMGEYLVYNSIDKEYKYQREERSFQSIARHRSEKGLPAPFRMSDLEIQDKYGFEGLVKTKQPGYVINFLYAFLFYPVGIFFSYLIESNQPNHSKRLKTEP